MLQALYAVHSERMLVEQLEYNLLFRWFVGLGMDDAVWTPTTFTRNRERLLAGDIARRFFTAVLAQARGRRLLPDEHFTVDGTLLEAWAGLDEDRAWTAHALEHRQKSADPPTSSAGSKSATIH